jgi:hypothetical protein
VISLDPLRPPLLPTNPLRVNRVNAVISNHQNPQAANERRKTLERRKRPFKHRGAYEMRTGQDRRDIQRIDDQV